MFTTAGSTALTTGAKPEAGRAELIGLSRATQAGTRVESFATGGVAHAGIATANAPANRATSVTRTTTPRRTYVFPLNMFPSPSTGLADENMCGTRINGVQANLKQRRRGANSLGRGNEHSGNWRNFFVKLTPIKHGWSDHHRSRNSCDDIRGRRAGCAIGLDVGGLADCGASLGDLRLEDVGPRSGKQHKNGGNRNDRLERTSRHKWEMQTPRKKVVQPCPTLSISHP